MEVTVTLHRAAAASPSLEPVSPLPPKAAEVMVALTRHADRALRELITAHRAFVSNRTQRSNGALSTAVARAQQVLQALETVREQRERERHQLQQPLHTSASLANWPASPPAESRTQTKEEHQLYVRLEKARIDLRRVLPRAVVEVEGGDNIGEGGGTSAPGRSAASAAAALRSLLHTRSLLSVELEKMDSAVQGLAGSSESLAALQQSLLNVHSSMETAQLIVRALLTVQSRDDLLLRVSAVLFAFVVLYVVAQRVFRLFPAIAYVAVDEA